MRSNQSSLLGCAVGFLLCPATAGLASPEPVAPESIPAVAFFQPPDLLNPQLSPDGRCIGFIGRLGGNAFVYLLDRTTGKIHRPLSPGKGQADSFWWKGDRRVLVAARGEQGRVYFVQEIDSTTPREIVVLGGTEPSCVNPLPNDRDHVISYPRGFGHNVMEVDLRTGRDRTIETLQGTDNDCVTSLNGELRAYTHTWEREWRIAWRSGAGAPWHELKGKSDILPFRPVAMDADDRHLLVFAYDQGDTVALMRLDPDSGERKRVVQYPDRDVWEVASNPAGGTPPFVTAWQFGADAMVVLDESARPFYAVLAKSLPGLCNRWISSSADRSLRLIFSWSGRDPGRCFLYDARANTLAALGPCRADLPAASMSEVRPFTYQTRDGVSESGYVILPQKNPAGSPPPLVVFALHQVGESADCGRDFNGPMQFLASRGYAVARFAVRGCYGFGRKFEQGADFAVNGRLIHDVEDGVRYLTQSGWVDGRRVALLGFDAGGLIALRTAAASPLFRTAAVVNCWSDIPIDEVAWLTSSPAETTKIIEQLGGTKAAYQVVRQLEPDTFLASLSVPVLIAYTSEYVGLADNGGKLRRRFAHFKKPYESFELEAGGKTRTPADRQAELFTKIVDFLKRKM